jgi:hypothetical protein
VTFCARSASPSAVCGFFGRGRDALLVAGFRGDVLALGAVEVQKLLDRTAFLGRTVKHGVLQHQSHGCHHCDANGDPPSPIELHRTNCTGGRLSFAEVAFADGSGQLAGLDQR